MRAFIEVTDTDINVLKLLHEYGILSVEQVALALGKTSTQYLRKRLTLLYHRGYLARPPIQEKIYARRTGKGNRPLVHSLGQLGAEYLHKHFGYELNTSNWDDKARNRSGRRGEIIFEHDLGTNGVLISLKNAYANLEATQVYSQSEIVEQSSKETQSLNRPFSLLTKYLWPAENKMIERNIIPDGVFGYEVKRDKLHDRRLVFVEYDQDSMPIKRGVGDRTSILQKVAGYNAIHQAGLIKERFAYDHFHVLFITTGSDTRLKSMIEVAGEYGRKLRTPLPPWLCYFTTLDAFTSKPPLSDIWRDGWGKEKAFARS